MENENQSELFKMCTDAKKYIDRKIRGIKYEHTTLPVGYEELNQEYRRLRNNIPILEGLIKTLGSYEYGGSVLKNFYQWTNVISESAHIDALKSEDIFSSISIVGKALADSSTKPEVQEKCSLLSDSYSNIKKAKDEMNAKLEAIANKVVLVKENSKTIDKIRNKVLSVRFDLEKLMQSTIYEENNRETLETQYKNICQRSEKEMKSFLDVNITTIIVEVAQAHQIFSAVSTNELKKVTPP